MRMIFTLILTFTLLLSCSAEYVGDPFSAFAGETEAEASLVLSGSGSSFSYSDNAVLFTAPAEINGYKLQRSGEKAYLSYGELSVPVSVGACRVLRLCEAVFSPEKATEIKAVEINGATVTVVKSGELTYTFSSDGKPISVSGSFEGETFEMTFSDFRVRSK